MNHLSISQICRISMFASITVIISQISVPMPYGVPMTLQTFIIPLVAFLIGKTEGTLVAVLYLLLGGIGLPVFAGFTGGLNIIFGPTGGFILSFPLMAYLSGVASKKEHTLPIIVWLSFGMIMNLIVGMIYFSFITSSSLLFSLNVCVLPFVPTSIIKVILIFFVGKKLSFYLSKRIKS